MASNPVSQALSRLVELLEVEGLENETRELDDFYDSVRRRAQALDNAEARQKVLLELYERFSRWLSRKRPNGWVSSTRLSKWWTLFCTPPTTPCSSISGGG